MAYVGDDQIVALAVQLRKRAFTEAHEKIAARVFQPALEKLASDTQASAIRVSSENLSMSLHFTQP
jgi:hypothetical protein